MMSEFFKNKQREVALGSLNPGQEFILIRTNERFTFINQVGAINVKVKDNKGKTKFLDHRSMVAPMEKKR